MADMTPDDFEQKLQELGFTSTPSDPTGQASASDEDTAQASLPPAGVTGLQAVPEDQQNAALLSPELPSSDANASYDPSIGAGKQQLFSLQPSTSAAPSSDEDDSDEDEDETSQSASATPGSPAQAATPSLSALPVSSQPTKPSMVNPLENPSVNDQALQNAQKQGALRSLIGNIGEGLGTFGAIGSGKQFDPSFYKEIQQQANQPVQNIQERRDAMVKSLQTAGIVTDLAIKNMSAQDQLALNDPNSAQSKGLKNLIQHYEPWLAKDPSWQAMNGSDAMNATKYLETEAKIQASQAQRDLSNQYKQSAQAQKVSQFNQGQQDKISKEVNSLNQSSRTALGASGRSLVSADRALDTLNQPVVTNQQLANISQDIAAIYNNGQATASSTQKNQYNTLYSKVQGLLQQATGQPQDAVPDSIKTQLRDTLTGMRNISSQIAQKNLAFVQISHPDFAKANPKYFDDIAKGLANETSQSGSSTPGTASASSTTPASYTPDVVSYASQHGITPAQALAIKQQRTGAQ